MTANEGMRRVNAEAFEPVLRPRGFVRVGGQQVWVRAAGELNHLIAILHRRRQYDVQWGVLSEGAAEVIWDAASDMTDPSQAVLAGTPGNIRHPAPGQSWTLDDIAEDPLAGETIQAIRADLELVADRLTAFTARRQLRDYLLLNRDPVDHRDFLVPANLPLKLLVAATLAALDQDVAVCALLPEVERAIAPYRDQLNRGRLARLRQLSEVLCGPGVE